MGTKAWRVVVAPGREVVEAVGQESHIVQVNVRGVFPSRVAFARAVMDADLAFGSESSADRYIATYGDHGWDDPRMEPGQVYVQKLDARNGDPLIPWPPKEA